MLDLRGMRNTPLMPSLPGPLSPRVEAPNKGPIYGINTTKRWLAFTVFIQLNCVFILNCLKVLQIKTFQSFFQFITNIIKMLFKSILD